jgi:hypothetical protein
MVGGIVLPLVTATLTSSQSGEATMILIVFVPFAFMAGVSGLVLLAWTVWTKAR